MAESTQTLAAVAAVALVGTLFSVAMFETPAKTTAYVVQVRVIPYYPHSSSCAGPELPFCAPLSAATARASGWAPTAWRFWRPLP